MGEVDRPWGRRAAHGGARLLGKKGRRELAPPLAILAAAVPPLAILASAAQPLALPEQEKTRGRSSVARELVREGRRSPARGGGGAAARGRSPVRGGEGASVFVSHGEGGGSIPVNTEEEASVSWAGSSKQMESRAVLELVSACECQDHPNNRIEGIQGQCQFLGLNTNIQTGH